MGDKEEDDSTEYGVDDPSFAVSGTCASNTVRINVVRARRRSGKRSNCLPPASLHHSQLQTQTHICLSSFDCYGPVRAVWGLEELASIGIQTGQLDLFVWGLGIDGYGVELSFKLAEIHLN